MSLYEVSRYSLFDCRNCLNRSTYTTCLTKYFHLECVHSHQSSMPGLPWFEFTVLLILSPFDFCFQHANFTLVELLKINISFHCCLFSRASFFAVCLKIFCASFFQADSAIAALSCSGVILGALPIRLARLIFDFNCS